MSDERLAEIEGRANRAADGPWDLYYPNQCCLNGYCIGEYHGLDLNHADALFVAHAREDVPALLAEVKRLRQIQPCPNPARHVEVRHHPRAARPEPIGYTIAFRLEPSAVAVISRGYRTPEIARESFAAAPHAAIRSDGWQVVALVPVEDA